MEEELLSRVREGENVTRLEIMEHYPKGDEHRQYERFEKCSLNLERQLIIAKQFEEVAGRRKTFSIPQGLRSL